MIAQQDITQTHKVGAPDFKVSPTILLVLCGNLKQKSAATKTREANSRLRGRNE